MLVADLDDTAKQQRQQFIVANEKIILNFIDRYLMSSVASAKIIQAVTQRGHSARVAQMLYYGTRDRLDMARQPKFKELQGVVDAAPAFAQLVMWACGLSTLVIPADERPSDDLLEAILELHFAELGS